MAEFTLDVHLDGRGVLDTIGEDVRRGLSAPQKYLFPKYLYDATGSLIFEQITELPEYYPTRTELAILCAQREDILRRAAPFWSCWSWAPVHPPRSAPYWTPAQTWTPPGATWPST